jgi:hypothetical protein
VAFALRTISLNDAPALGSSISTERHSIGLKPVALVAVIK